MKQIDLHVHSTCSDGTLTPAELVRHAFECGLAAFALTDHDNTNGLPAAIAAASAYNIEIIPGIEFSTEYLGKDIHIVGLDIDWMHPDFQKNIERYQQERLDRNQQIINKMAADGIDISHRQMAEAFGETIWTRAHFARYLAEHGYVAEMQDAFRTHIGDGCKYFVPRKKVNPFEVVRLIRRFHGIPVLAHPFQYRFSDIQLYTLLEKLKEAGLIGIEAYYSTHTKEQTDYVLGLSGTLGLLPSGGSDFHGANKPTIALGSGKNNLQIPYEILTHLRQRLIDDRKIG